jgi:uncharacterized protein YbaP (TraB family)
MHFVCRAFAPLLLLLVAAPLSAAPALWKFGNKDTTIYLFGTIHALPPHYQWQDGRIAKAMAKSDTLVVETVIEKDPQALAKLFPPPDPSLPPIIERVAPKYRKAFAAQIARSRIDQTALDRMPTWQAAFVLMGVLMKDIGVERASGVENVISDSFAAPQPDRSGPRKVEGLETPASQLALFANLSEVDQRELLESMVTGNGDAKTDYRKMLHAWISGNEAAIARAFANDKDLTPHLRDVLLKRRNSNWADWLDKRLDTPGTVFVAVGAGHLAGPNSVQNMLAAKGIKVERIYYGRRTGQARGSVQRRAAVQPGRKEAAHGRSAR